MSKKPNLPIEGEIYLATYKVCKAARNQFYLQVPPPFVRSQGIEKGQRMFCYMDGGEKTLVFRTSEGEPSASRSMLNVYKVSASGQRNMRLKVSPLVRDSLSLVGGEAVTVHQNSSGELIYHIQ